jgi:ABC-2 type transport system permease protein
MRNVWIIASREFKLYFVSPLAYVVAGVMFLILGLIFYINIAQAIAFGGGSAAGDGRIVIGALVWILLFATPAITMRLLADEYRMGTVELLLTSPVRDWELVVGKWLGSLLFMILLLGLTWIYPLIVHRLTSPGIDQGVLVSVYVGLLAMVAALLALGVLVSSLFKNPVAAFFATLGAVLALWVMGGLAGLSTEGSTWLRYLSFVDHFGDNFYRGVLDLADFIYYASVTAFSLFAASQVVESRRWR